MDWAIWVLIILLFVWCWILSFYLYRLQMLVGRLLLRLARIEQAAEELR